MELRDDNTYAISFPKIVAHVLSSLGMKWGPKVKSNQGLPSFVFNLNGNKKAKFIRQFFNDEGNVRTKDRRLQVKQTITTKQTKEKLKSNIIANAPNILKDISSILYDLNITSKISLGHYRRHKNKTKTDWELSIYGKENLDKFRNLIGFDLKYKFDLLNKCLKSYVHPSAGRNQRTLYALQYSALIELESTFIDKFKLSNVTKRAVWRTTTYYLVDLLKAGFIEVIEKPMKRGKMLPWKYRLTKSGWEHLKNNREFIFLEKVKNVLG
jgi:hypothetical protein